MSAENKPLVSIWCMTYNHVDYIRDALDGFLKQETSFEYEIIVHDDASTDGTAQVLREYEQKYPQKIKVICQKENTYKHPDRIAIMRNIKEEFLKGKYVALCEGDDYWTDENKLQKQVDYMESHERCMLTMHNAKLVNYEKNISYEMNPYYETGIVDIETVFMRPNGIFPTASFVVRREMCFLEDFFYEPRIGDWPLQLNCFINGYIYYIDEIMSVYRYMHTNSWSSESLNGDERTLMHCLRMSIFLFKFNEYTDFQFDVWVQKRRNQYMYTMSDIRVKIGDERYEKVLKSYNELNMKNIEYVKEIDRIVGQIKKISFDTRELEQFCKRNTHLVMWGCGKYAQNCLSVLEKKGIDVDGFIVTNKNGGNESYRGKKVWDIEDFPYSYDDVGIIAAVGMWTWNEILVTIFENKINNIYSPFISLL